MDQTRKIIRRILTEGLSYQVDAHRVDGILVLNYFEIPRELRGQGYGRRAYEEWEASLPEEFERIDLCAVDAGEGLTTGFWEKMGYEFKFDTSEYDDPETNCWMWKGINGHPTPPTHR